MIGSINFEFYRNELFPPDELNKFVGGGDFNKVGNTFFHYFTELGKLQPYESVLDVGCGVGRMAMPLTKFLNNGKYEGFDIYPEGIKWCKDNIEFRFPNFHFNLIDIYNKRYNKNGKLKASEFKFPYQNHSFDFVFLTSIFTHLLSKDMENYFSEITRVMKKNGRCLISYFLLNKDSLNLMNNEESKLNFIHDFNGFKSASKTNPESVIAYDEKYIRALYEKNKLEIEEPIRYGVWFGRKENLGFQDIILAKKN